MLEGMVQAHAETLRGISDSNCPGISGTSLSRTRKYIPAIIADYCTRSFIYPTLSDVRTLLDCTSRFTLEVNSLQLESIEEFSINDFGEKTRCLAPVQGEIIGLMRRDQ